MAEEAYSIELGRDIAADVAVDMRKRGALIDERAFLCKCYACRIPMTCVNWNNPEGQRKYFTTSKEEFPQRTVMK